MSLVITLPQMMNSSSSTDSSNNSTVMTQIKSRNVQQQHQQAGKNLGTDHLPVLSTISHPISSSSYRYFSKNKKSSSSSSSSLIMGITIVVTFVLAVALLFSDQISNKIYGITNESRRNDDDGDGGSLLAQQQNHQVLQQQQRKNSNDFTSATTTTVEESSTAIVKKKKLLVKGIVTLKDGTTTIEYYHQPAATSATDERQQQQRQDLILLHGAAFTKEDWIKQPTNIISKFHEKFPTISITAFDLPVTADHRKLVDLLESSTSTMVQVRRDQEQEHEDYPLISSLPVSGLVTPSASGKTISDWIVNDDDDLPISKLGQYIRHWIPVASGSVKRCTGEQLKRVGMLKRNNNNNSNNNSSFDIYAIYGDKDRNGKVVTVQLVQYADAKLLQLKGRHPVYLDSPNEFVQAVGTEIVG